MAIPRGQHHQSKFIFSCQHRYFNGFSSPEWHCSFAQELAPRLVTCRHQVRDHDNSRCEESKRNANSRSHFSSSQPICHRLRPCQPCESKRPGLIYDIQPDDYVPYLCGLKYTDNEIQVVTQKKLKCLEVKSIAEAQLNYPSFSIALGPTSSPQTYSRTVTNVGPPSSTYKVKVVSPRGVSVKVMPEVIKFTEVKQKATYNVTFSNNGAEQFGQGFPRWVSSEHRC